MLTYLQLALLYIQYMSVMQLAGIEKQWQSLYNYDLRTQIDCPDAVYFIPQINYY